MSLNVVVIPVEATEPLRSVGLDGPDPGYGIAVLLGGSWEQVASIEDTAVLLVDAHAHEHARPANTRAAAILAGLYPEDPVPDLRGTVVLVGTDLDGDFVDPYIEDLTSIEEILGAPIG